MEPEKVNQRGIKRRVVQLDGDDEDRLYRFKVLLPNGMAVELRLNNPVSEMPFEDFIRLVKKEYCLAWRQSESTGERRHVRWNERNLYLQDANDNKIEHKIKFANFKSHKCHFLRLHDGTPEACSTYENMWDLTPDTDLLKELPEEYTFEAALADLIDNSLQAVWSNDKDDRRLISVDIMKDSISIFDTGPGMDDNDEKSIVKWGKMGASLHRSFKAQAIGGKPPYLMPFFGMFGCGGSTATMHLGRRAIVSSKTKEARKVYTLNLERDALIRSSGSELTWRTNGGIRDPSEDEIEKSLQGSFTKVQIQELKIKNFDIYQLQCKLKDIYFPYIQCDEVSNAGKTTRPIEFEVNGVDLAEIEGGEVSITNLHSCNGPEFVFQIHFLFKQDNASPRSPGKQHILSLFAEYTGDISGLRASREANARIKCVYFPIVEGKENIEKILEKLEAEGCGITQNYETISRVSIRRLGRLLPDARWPCLPFMEFKHRKVARAHLLKRCCSRVKCFIETDGGFNPTPSKTDLAHHSPFTIALKNFSKKGLEKENEVNIEIYQDGKSLTPLQLDKAYQDWIVQMHDRYDEEIDCGEDDPVLVVGPTNKKALCISSDVVRVHRILKRKGSSWKCGQKIKVLKGACPRVHKNNVYATIEYFLIEGFQGDGGGEAWIICRPISVADDNGCALTVKDGNASLDIHSSLSLPINVIDSGKCHVVESAEWNCQLDRQRKKAPSKIDLLCAEFCQELEIGGGLPINSTIHAGQIPPSEIVAVVRPANYTSSKGLDQKYIYKSTSEMSMLVKFERKVKDHRSVEHLYSARRAPSATKGFNGLYIFPLGSKFPELFQRAGLCTFIFSLIDSSDVEDKSVSHSISYQVTPRSLLNVRPQSPIQEKHLLPGLVVKELILQMLDEYNNYVKEGTEVQIYVDGFDILDQVGLKRKVDGNGCIDLSGVLKVTAGFGKSASLSVSWCEKVVFKQEFQIDRRELRIASKIPEVCIAGSKLEDIAFQVVNSEGVVDEIIHNEEKCGWSHMLTITSDSFNMEDSMSYPFRHGSCTVSAIPLPQLEGDFWFTAAHSHYPELQIQLSFKVTLMTAPKLELDDAQSHSQSSDNKLLLLRDSSPLERVEIIMLSAVKNQKDLEADIYKYGQVIGSCEGALTTLDRQKAEIEQLISKLKASLEPHLDIVNNFPTKQEMLDRIKSKSHSAAAVLCQLSQDFSFQEPQNCFMEDIIGLVALLGTVCNTKLSRMLAEYLGEDHMLAVVCKSYEAASALEKYTENGEVDSEVGLHAEAASLGKSISGRFLLVCLEDIRPYPGELEGVDPQRKLILPEPTSPSGDIASGFIGYAVNLFELDIHQLNVRTSTGHGLRETLFYSLFGDLQVYETRKHMKDACACIKDGAISLDGGILRKSGVISLGFGNPDICFPVVPPDNKMHLIPLPVTETKIQLEVKQRELEETTSQIEMYTRSHERAMKKFRKRSKKHVKLTEQLGECAKRLDIV